MTSRNFELFAGDKLNKCLGLLFKKNKDYTVNDDALSNFKELAKEMGVSPLKIWYQYVWKHFAAIRTFVKDGKVESEGISSRFTDMINYMLLGEALFMDEYIGPMVAGDFPMGNAPEDGQKPIMPRNEIIENDLNSI